MFPLHLHPLTSSSPQIHNNPNLCVEPKKSNNPELHHPSLAEGIFSDAISSVRTCITTRDLKLGSCVHAKIVKSGLHSDEFISNSLIDMYSKCDHIEQAANVFDKMPHRTVVSWTSMMSGYCQKGLADKVIALFEQILETLPPNEYTLAVLLRACAKKCDAKLVEVIHCFAMKYGFDRDDFLQNSLIDAYAKSGKLEAAEEVLDRFSGRDVVSWTSAISGHVGNGMVKRALVLFFKMQEDGVEPNEVTILSILQACSKIGELHIFQWIHGLVMKTEWCRNAPVTNALVEMYVVNGYFNEAKNIFCSFCFNGEGLYLSPETMASLLQGCADSGSFVLGEAIHGYLIKHGFFPCTAVENSLMDMYGESGKHNFAFQAFRMMSAKDIITWNTLMTCLVKNERSSEVLKLLSEIHAYGAEDDIFPDFITMLTSIQACSDLAAFRLGQVIHGYMMRAGLISDIFIQNSLIDMYGKSGSLDFAEQIFEDMPVRDLGSWNSLIAAYGINGSGTSALQIFTKLQESGIYQPNAITFVNILSACGRAGLIEAACEIFHCMTREYGIDPRMEHFACMVDLLGRSGRLDESRAFIEKMSVRPGPDVWGALLGASALFNNVEMAEKAARKLAVLEPNSNVWRVALSNVYASVGRWEDASKARAEMRKSEELKKEDGWSSVDVRGNLHRFTVADTTYPESETIYEVLNGMQEQMREIAITDSRVA
ncbi:Pentatricopeptide repeat-containing protein [Actinidia chinensis var. chinensis]|uniref:Pentatricopeptide repeat-containing protein n=1 Tax=Actinidia chinensis var. chinensis TaxID=1590841 RepID=A0A2R6Q8G8_ACTCC|nr:Pentatricopeptide repeat-containing protein [Actinidia chinensis var. chinensis]